MGVSTDLYVAIEHWRLSSIKIIFVDYQTSELQYNYQSYIQERTIRDAWGFSSIAPIVLSESFSGKVLIGVRRTLLQETESNKSIPTIEDGISRLFHYYYENMLREKMANIEDRLI